VVKANAYGHGAIVCARALSREADGYAVAFLDEALALREAGIDAPILLLEGVFDAAELIEAARHKLWPAVHHAAQIEMIEKTALPAPLRVWLKLNSGMNRAGFLPGEARPAWARLTASGKVKDCGFMTHFARADEPGIPATAGQIHIFDDTLRGLPGERSLANSAAILGWPNAHRDWARPGIMLYGADPMPDESYESYGLPPGRPKGDRAPSGGSEHSERGGCSSPPGRPKGDNTPSGDSEHSERGGCTPPLRPVMTLESRIIAVRELTTGEPLGYGARFVVPRPTRVGLVAMGYADGYPRSAPDGTPVAVDGRLTSLIGRVSMDMLTIDLTALPDAGIGSAVELWGKQVSINRVAQAAGTISYELLCNVKRVTFIWNGSD
jgi:alanine racemase